MTTRLDALCARENKGKAYFTKIGAAFPNRDGKGFSVVLDAVPAPMDGQFKILLREPLPKDDAKPDPQPSAEDLDDDIPF